MQYQDEMVILTIAKTHVLDTHLEQTARLFICLFRARVFYLAVLLGVCSSS